jgi:hypothetical protein
MLIVIAVDNQLSTIRKTFLMKENTECFLVALSEWAIAIRSQLSAIRKTA